MVQIFVDVGLVDRVGRESLLVRWAGNKRDRVDEILVRELQVGWQGRKGAIGEQGAPVEQGATS